MHIDESRILPGHQGGGNTRGAKTTLISTPLLPTGWGLRRAFGFTFCEAPLKLGINLSIDPREISRKDIDVACLGGYIALNGRPRRPKHIYKEVRSCFHPPPFFVVYTAEDIARDLASLSLDLALAADTREGGVIYFAGGGALALLRGVPTNGGFFGTGAITLEESAESAITPPVGEIFGAWILLGGGRCRIVRFFTAAGRYYNASIEQIY